MLEKSTGKLLKKLSKLLEAEYNKLQERWEEIEKRGENPFDEWNAFLDTLGHVKTVSYECHWHPEYGVPHLIDELFNIINGDKPVYVVDFDNGSNMSQTLFFERDKLIKWMQNDE